ncbi:hypothetical protein C2E23DRAFT_888403 [Lenzites betulinus]|nr:hypothetical protein C2E23DRAFT_888403 [Lenzites betulinus]
MFSAAPAAPAAPTHIWWSNAVFFVGIHLAAAVAVLLRPPSQVPQATLWLMVILWQAASMGITVGYHRMYSHRAFRATLPVRALIALLGASAFQGSIKRVTKATLNKVSAAQIASYDPVHDPYAATKGFLWSHLGWIFFKSRYDRMKTIDQDDLDKDLVVRLQHQYYVPLALLTGFGMPVLIGLLWNDPVGAFVYASLVARLLIWHCTFLVNSLAHWDGLQPYSDDNTSKSNLLLALLTCGEGNHNFHVSPASLDCVSHPRSIYTPARRTHQHSFPHDFRSGPSPLDWDPSKWAIMLLHSLGLASGLRRARADEIRAAREHMLRKEISHLTDDTSSPSMSGSDEDEDDVDQWDGPVWTHAEATAHARTSGGCVLLLDGYAVDAAEYLGEHPGGALLLRRYAIGAVARTQDADMSVHDADWAFHGGINKHSLAARRRMRQLRVAKVQ